MAAVKARVGVDGRKLPADGSYSAVGQLRQAHALGLEGVYFRSLFEMSATLDPAELAEVRATADELGLYLHAGIGKVNPYATPETPEIREFGGGDYLAAMTRMVTAAANIGIHELWSGTANYKFGLPKYFVFDRFRTDVSWADQLAATTSFLNVLAPVLRDHGTHLNIETHEEISSFELVRIVEAVGTDALGITFDVGNVLVRGEDPVAAARRVAPYVRATHIKDAALFHTEFGIGHQLVPVGAGVIDWSQVLTVLLAHDPAIELSIENPQLRFEMPLHVDDPVWLASHADLPPEELATVKQLATAHEAKVAAGLAPGRDELLSSACDRTDQLDYITRSAAHLREQLARLTEEE